MPAPRRIHGFASGPAPRSSARETPSASQHFRHGLLALGALLAFAPAASACPYCALSQGTDTLIFILCFLVIPYLVVSGVWFWMKRVLAAERAEQLEQTRASSVASEPAPPAN